MRHTPFRHYYFCSKWWINEFYLSVRAIWIDTNQKPLTNVHSSNLFRSSVARFGWWLLHHGHISQRHKYDQLFALPFPSSLRTSSRLHLSCSSPIASTEGHLAMNAKSDEQVSFCFHKASSSVWVLRVIQIDVQQSCSLGTCAVHRIVNDWSTGTSSYSFFSPLDPSSISHPLIAYPFPSLTH